MITTIFVLIFLFLIFTGMIELIVQIVQKFNTKRVSQEFNSHFLNQPLPGVSGGIPCLRCNSSNTTTTEHETYCHDCAFLTPTIAAEKEVTTPPKSLKDFERMLRK